MLPIREKLNIRGYVLLASMLLSACGAGSAPEENESLELGAAIGSNAIPTASVSASDANIVSSGGGIPTELLNASVPDIDQTESAGIDVDTDIIEAIVPSTQSEASVPSTQSEANVPSTQSTVAQVNETYSESEAEEAADSVSLTGCVGNLAWVDSNADGIKNSSEIGIAISKIELVSEAGNVVDTTSTDSGYYQLCSLPGTYQIVFEIPVGYEVTSKDEGNSDTADSDASEAGVIVAEVFANKNKTKYDLGLVSLSSQDIQSMVAQNSSVEAVPETNLPEQEAPVSVVLSETTPNIAQTTPVSEPQTVEETSPVTIAPVQETVEQSSTGNIVDGSNQEIRWGFWTETRNSYQSPLGEVDEGVESTFENYTFSHVKAQSLNSLGGDNQSKEYVVNVISAAEKTNTSLDLQLGSAGEYGWNFSTGRGNFQLSRWKDAVSKFSASADPVGHAAIVKAIKNGTIRYIFLIDEPNHRRWSPAWNGKHGAEATGSSNHVTNQDLDEMAAHVKAVFGDDAKTIVRTSAVNLITAARNGMYVFQHMTHAYLTISSTKWVAGSNKGPNKGFEWFLTLKNNHTDNTTNLSAFKATNLQPSIMIQAGFQSNGNPWTGEKNFATRWWQGNVRYPFNGATGYVKSAPAEMDFWIKSLLSPRDPNTGVLSNSGIRWFNEFVIFRSDRLPTDNGRLPFSTYPHYRAFLDQLGRDLRNNNLKPIVGVPVGWTGD